MTTQPTKIVDAITPYNGSSGWSGSDTSKERADTNDANGTTRKRQQDVLIAVYSAGSQGMTWYEVNDVLGLGHGSVSGALSVLHKEGRISRLTEKRGKCKVYVVPDFENGRPTERQGRGKHVCPHCGFRS